jgi:DeoR/GlpR family transcriptional regulator of sugar metabolism
VSEITKNDPAPVSQRTAAQTDRPEIEREMPRLVWMVLNDGRSVVAGCGTTTTDILDQVFERRDAMLVLTSDDGIEHIASAAVRNYVVFDSKSQIPPATSIYRLVHV